MATRENLDKKLLLLEQRLHELGKVPTQKEDRALYANVKYYYTNYPNHPIVQRIKTQYPLNSSSSRKTRNTMSRDESIDFIITRVNELGYIPGPTEDRFLYQKVKYLYENYSENPGVASLMEQYPLEKKKSPSMFAGMTFEQKVDYLESFLIKYQRIPPVAYGMTNRITSNVIRFYERSPDEPKVRRLMFLYPSYDVYNKLISEFGTIESYIEECIKTYSQLPGDKSIPMVELSKACSASNYKRYYNNGKSNLAVQLVESIYNSNIKSERIIKLYELIINNNS